MITALVLFKVEKGKIPKLANQLGAIDEVVEVLSITGEHDLIAKIQVRELTGEGRKRHLKRKSAFRARS